MRLLQLSILTLGLLLAPSASAQQSSAVQHYRAYLSALERGDVQAAASEAQLALEASQARDGDGGRTAVLALNVATSRLAAGDAAAATQAAQYALNLARGGADGVNVDFAELILARANLALGAEDAAAVYAERLSALLNAPSAETLDDQEVYLAGTQLGNWGLEHSSYELAQRGWAAAGARPSGSPSGAAFGLGRARTYEAISIILNELDRHRLGRFSQEDAYDAHALLSEAARALRPLTDESPSLELTAAQQMYAESRAWISALEALLMSEGVPVPEAPEEAQGDADGWSEVGAVDLTRPRCQMRLVASPLPRYAISAQVAAVVVFFRVNAAGEIEHSQIAARAGAEQFATEVERVVGRWRVEREEGSTPNCRMESNILRTIRFVARR